MASTVENALRTGRRPRLRYAPRDARDSGSTRGAARDPLQTPRGCTRSSGPGLRTVRPDGSDAFVPALSSPGLADRRQNSLDLQYVAARRQSQNARGPWHWLFVFDKPLPALLDG